MNADFRLWKADTYETISVKEDAHDYGIQSCDFSQNLDPVPNNIIDVQSYLLGTCGNDGFVKLWSISVPKKVRIYCFRRERPLDRIFALEERRIGF